MKNIVLAILTFLTVHSCVGQSCATPYFSKLGSALELNDIDKNGQVRSKQLIKVTRVDNTAEGITSIVNTTRIDAQGKVTESRDTRFVCTASGTKKYVGFDDTQTKQEAFLFYPFSPQPGEKIPGDVSYDIEQVNDQGKKTKMGSEIRNRFFQNMEDVTTPAGSFHCMRIKYDLKVKVKLGFVTIPVQIDATEWYSPEAGVVKMEGFINGTRETFIQLVAIK
jgi:hypothetical protein